jgi:hypothetical protein
MVNPDFSDQLVSISLEKTCENMVHVLYTHLVHLCEIAYSMPLVKCCIECSKIVYGMQECHKTVNS